VPPIEIRCRLSTDVIALEDREVAMALTYIRNHATSNLLVRDVLYHVQISQSTLERRFMAALGRTPKQEIDRVRLEAIRRLLAETQWKIAHVAQHLGFKHAEYLAAFVKVHTGQTPQQWRKELQNLR
jgi:LacI family transcriptional regulator